MRKVLDIRTLDSVGKRVAFARTFRSLTQQELSDRAGIAQSSLASLESGRNKGSRNLVGLAKALNVSPDWLDSGKTLGRSLTQILNAGFYLGAEISDVPDESDIDKSVSAPSAMGSSNHNLGLRMLNWTARSIFNPESAYKQTHEGQNRFNWPHEHSDQAFLLRAPFDQHTPGVKSGDIMLVEPRHEPIHGKVVIAMDGEGEILLGRIAEVGQEKMLIQAKTAGDERIYNLGALLFGGVITSLYQLL
jgi:transcriptional regulator with XRE-family HTH domain